MFDVVIDEIIEVVNEDLKDKVDDYTLRYDLTVVLERFIESNNWAIKAKLKEIAERFRDGVKDINWSMQMLTDDVENDLEKVDIDEN